MKPKLIKNLGPQLPSPNSKKKYIYGIFECPNCKKEYRTIINHVNSGRSTKCKWCGPSKHKDYKTRLYGIWANMKSRCDNKNNNKYEYYGGRGIKYYISWSKYENFKKWALLSGYKENLEIDRIDNNKNYEPLNCRWTDRTTQNINTRLIRSNNTSGYRGINYHSHNNTWESRIHQYNKAVFRKRFKCIVEAVISRDLEIINNKYHHPTNILKK